MSSENAVDERQKIKTSLEDFLKEREYKIEKSYVRNNKIFIQTLKDKTRELYTSPVDQPRLKVVKSEYLISDELIVGSMNSVYEAVWRRYNKDEHKSNFSITDNELRQELLLDPEIVIEVMKRLKRVGRLDFLSSFSQGEVNYGYFKFPREPAYFSCSSF